MNKYTFDDIKPGFFYYTKESIKPFIALIIFEIDQKRVSIYFSDRKTCYECQKNSVLDILNNSDIRLKGIKVD